MRNSVVLVKPDCKKFKTAVFITFSGNCKKALTFYQTCFGGLLQFETFDKNIEGYKDSPIISGVLLSDRLTIYGSDLVHDEGRKIGNYVSIYLACRDTSERKMLVKKLDCIEQTMLMRNDKHQKLIEVADAFDLRWILGV